MLTLRIFSTSRLDIYKKDGKPAEAIDFIKEEKYAFITYFSSFMIAGELIYSCFIISIHFVIINRFIVVYSSQYVQCKFLIVFCFTIYSLSFSSFSS